MALNNCIECRMPAPGPEMRFKSKGEKKRVICVCVCACTHVYYGVCFHSQPVLTGAEDLLLLCAAPSSHSVIWRSCSPPLARIDFWLGGFYIPAEISAVSKESPRRPAAPPLFSVQMKYWWEALAPFFPFIPSLTPALALSLILAVLPLFSWSLYAIFRQVVPCLFSTLKSWPAKNSPDWVHIWVAKFSYFWLNLKATWLDLLWVINLIYCSCDFLWAINSNRMEGGVLIFNQWAAQQWDEQYLMD